MATIIAQIACDENDLPQGSPCSPVISNLVGHLLDARLARLAKIYKCTYSRYVDDITLSTSRKDFPPELAAPVSGSKSGWQLGAELRSKIEHSGFKINDKKTRMQFRGSRQVTTGLMVNEKVNIRRSIGGRRDICAKRFSQLVRTTERCLRLCWWSAGDPPTRQDITSLNPIGGMLAHIHHVKDHADQRKSALKEREPNAARHLYFLFLVLQKFRGAGRSCRRSQGKDRFHLSADCHSTITGLSSPPRPDC